MRKQDPPKTPVRRQPPRAAKRMYTSPLPGPPVKKQKTSRTNIRKPKKASTARKGVKHLRPSQPSVDTQNLDTDSAKGRSKLVDDNDSDISPIDIAPKSKANSTDNSQGKTSACKSGSATQSTVQVNIVEKKRTSELSKSHQIENRSAPINSENQTTTSTSDQKARTNKVFTSPPHINNDTPTEEELVIARAFADTQLGRGIPWDFQVPYGYEQIVKVSGRPPNAKLEVKAIEWGSQMRLPEWTALSQRIHEVVHGPITPILSPTPSPVEPAPLSQKRPLRDSDHNLPPKKKPAFAKEDNGEKTHKIEVPVLTPSPLIERRENILAKLAKLKSESEKNAASKNTAEKDTAEKIRAKLAKLKSKSEKNAAKKNETEKKEAENVVHKAERKQPVSASPKPSQVTSKVESKTPLADARKKKAEERAAKHKAIAAQVSKTATRTSSTGQRQRTSTPPTLIQEKYIKIHAVGKATDWECAYQEQFNNQTLTSAAALNLKSISKADINVVDKFYAANRRAGIIPWKDDVPYGYPGLTRWKWTGPVVLDLIDWDGPKVTARGARELVIEKFQKTGAMVTAAHTKGISEDQAKVANMVFGVALRNGILPEIWEVPYGYAGHVFDKEKKVLLRVNWDPVHAHKWEYTVRGEAVYWKKWIADPKKCKKPWWRELLSDENGGLDRAKKEGYVPYKEQICLSHDACREIDFRSSHGGEIEVKVIYPTVRCLSDRK